MTDTKTLIARLSSEAKAQTPLPSARYRAAALIAVLILYTIGAQLLLGLRADLAIQFTRPFFTVEIILLAVLLVTSVIASVLTMAPDIYQKPKLLLLPYVIFLLLLLLVLSQLFMPLDQRMVIPLPGAHGMECALCIASVAFVPSALIFILLRKGASVRLFQSGSFSVLAASSIGVLTLRLAEANDSILHLASWHYLPTVLFAIMGACLGKWLLKW